MSKKIIFQPPRITHPYCEVGLLDDDGYIYYLDEPAKIAVSEVKIIDEKDAVYNKKQRCYMIINQKKTE